MPGIQYARLLSLLPPAGISESYRSDPTPTTTTLAEALKLANDEGYAHEAAQVTIAALIEGGTRQQCMAEHCLSIVLWPLPVMRWYMLVPGLVAEADSCF
jgi:hypothetical protein